MREKTILKEVFQVFKLWKTRWIFAFLNAQFLPPLEASLVSCIYLIVSPENQSKLFAKLATVGWASPQILLFVKQHSGVFISCSALIILLIFTGDSYAQKFNLIRLRYKIYARDSQRLISRFLYLDTLAGRQFGKERISSGLINDCGSLGDILKFSFEIFGAFLFLILYSAGLFFLSWKFFLMIGVMISLPLWYNRRQFNKMREIGHLKVKSNERVLGFFSDFLNGFERSKIDALENELDRRSGKVLKQSQLWRIRKGQTQAHVTISMQGFSFFMLIVSLSFGLYVLEIPLAGLLILFVTFSRIQSYMTILSQSYLMLKERIPNCLRYTELLTEINELSTFNKGEKIFSPKSDKIQKIEMKNISFSYDDGVSVINDLSFEALSGDRILIQGPSGQGKTTFLELLCGLLPPTRGNVSYNDKPLTEDSFYSFRHLIAYASPTIHLFNTTIRRNLVMGDNRITQSDLEKTIELSGLSEDLKELPLGLDTVVGDNGLFLSLGQKQRVILARLYLKKPQLIVLDEATANLDKVLENEVLTKLHSFIDPMSILIQVSHKESDVIPYNKRYLLENGRLSQSLPLPKFSALTAQYLTP